MGQRWRCIIEDHIFVERMRCLEHVAHLALAHMWRVSYMVLMGDLRERNKFEDVVADGSIKLKWI